MSEYRQKPELPFELFDGLLQLQTIWQEKIQLQNMQLLQLQDPCQEFLVVDPEGVVADFKVVGVDFQLEDLQVGVTFEAQLKGFYDVRGYLVGAEVDDELLEGEVELEN